MCCSTGKSALTSDPGVPARSHLSPPPPHSRAAIPISDLVCILPGVEKSVRANGLLVQHTDSSAMDLLRAAIMGFVRTSGTRHNLEWQLHDSDTLAWFCCAMAGQPQRPQPTEPQNLPVSVAC